MASMVFGKTGFYARYIVFMTMTLFDEGTFHDLEVRSIVYSLCAIILMASAVIMKCGRVETSNFTSPVGYFLTYVRLRLMPRSESDSVALRKKDFP